MKKRIMKSVLSIALAVAMMLGEAGATITPVFAEQTQDETAGEATDVETPDEDVVEITSGNETYLNVYYVDANLTSEGYMLTSSYDATATKVEIYVNDKLVQTDDKTAELDAEGSIEPSISGSLKYQLPTYGKEYKVKFVSYNSTNEVGKTYETTIYAAALPSASIEDLYISKIATKNMLSKQTGFAKPIAKMCIYTGSYSENEYEITVYCSTKSGSSWSSFKEIGKAKIGTYSVYTYYQDDTIVIGKTYRYKAKVTAVRRGGKKITAAGVSGSAKAITIAKPSVGIYGGSYSSEGLSLSLDTDYASYIELYRSTSATKGFKKIATLRSTYYTDTKVKQGATYYYKAIPYFYDCTTGKTYKGAASSVIKAKLIQSDEWLSASQTASNKVTLNWTQVKGADKYEVYYKINEEGAGYKLLTTTTKTSYVVKTSTDEKYVFYVRAVKKSGSTVKYCQCDTAYIYTGFHAPDYVSAYADITNYASKKYTLKTYVSWTRVYGGTEGYIITAYDNTKGKRVTVKTIKKASTLSTTFTNTYTASKGYRYSDIMVQAYKGSKKSEGSGTWLSFPGVKNVKAKKASAYKNKITWTKQLGVKEYIVYRYTPLGSGDSVEIGRTTNNYIYDASLTPGVEYSYTVKAVYYGAEGDAWAGYTQSVSKTAIASAKNLEKGSATITWKKSNYATKYVIYRATSANGTYKKVKTVSAKSLSYTDTKLKKGTTYYYKVEIIAVNDAGLTVKSPKSAAKSIKITK